MKAIHILGSAAMMMTALAAAPAQAQPHRWDRGWHRWQEHHERWGGPRWYGGRGRHHGWYHWQGRWHRECGWRWRHHHREWRCY